MRVALFVTCYNDLLFPEVGRATVALLRRLGQDVEFPQAQTCCGQIHFNTGYRDECVPLVRQFVSAFDGYDVIVTPSASCAAMVRHNHATIAQHAQRSQVDVGLADQVARVTPRVYELTEFLVDVLRVVDVGARFDGQITFHPTCHSQRMLGVGDRPLRLLEAVQGLTIVPLANQDACCGFGGTFAVKNADTSVAMGEDKVHDVIATGAPTLVSSDTSCLMHIGGLMSRQGRQIQVMHLAQILAGDESRA